MRNIQNISYLFVREDSNDDGMMGNEVSLPYSNLLTTSEVKTSIPDRQTPEDKVQRTTSGGTKILCMGYETHFSVKQNEKIAYLFHSSHT